MTNSDQIILTMYIDIDGRGEKEVDVPMSKYVVIVDVGNVADSLLQTLMMWPRAALTLCFSTITTLQC